MEKKKTISKETKEKLKKGAIIALPIVFALVAAISMAALVGSMNRANEDEEPERTESESAADTVQVMVPEETQGEVGESGGLEYRIGSDGTCVVVGLGSCNDVIVRIPAQSPSGETVTGIGDRAFLGETGISEVRLPAGLISIGKEAFKGSGITVMNIPSSVVSIGDCAFARCTRLTAINVDGANPLFASVSGVLFDRTMETLMCYPSGKEDLTYIIPKSVKKIAAMAFSSCRYLSSIKYGGTEKQWGSVYVCTGNDTLNSIPLTFAPEEK